MSPSVQRHEGIEAAIKRLIDAHIQEGVEALATAPPDEAVHEARKACKKIRALLRLVRKEMDGAYKAENVHFRDAGRRVAALRDAAAHRETVDWLEEEAGEGLDEGLVERLRKAVDDHHEAVLDAHDVPERLARMRRDLVAGRARLETWSVDAEGFEAMAASLRKVAKRGRKALARAREAPSTDAFHDWRKRAKVLRYQVGALSPCWPAMMEPFDEALHDLTDLLGDDHDLAELQALLDDLPDEPLGDGAPAVRGAIEALRRDRQARALALGARIHGERPDALVARIGAWFRTWRDEAPAA